uniref:Uncharacterized protein AlNc14C103G6103 n=1 Tax=Albugo laibachii Nc14 TaxID=890382 RepID=F0WHP6_9STRA|nr:conserved hypothetical protein [Albugo laibachii Nc14]CCA23723.1 conserved hypothetical protein [Albugo laibachii Nc14]|eukprot:CCA23723.1 conserved hypothetical protein [Albugo laibachii Nc14]
MKNTVATVLLSLASAICAFHALAFPSWFQQKYKRDGNDIYQGFGLFAFRSTGAIVSPFYASVTTLQYSTFCNLKIIPNYMLGDGDSFREVLCSDSIRAVQATTISGATISVIALIASIAAVYFPRAGISERVISSTTLIASILLAVSLVLWGWLVQQKLYNIDSINSAYVTCKADDAKWSCWFYGDSFWTCLSSVVILSLAGYMSSAGRAEKIRYFRKVYTRDMELAMQASMEHDTASQAQRIAMPAPTTSFVRINSSSTGSFIADRPKHITPATATPSRSYPGLQTPNYVPPSTNHQSYSNISEESIQEAYPTRRSPRQNHSLLQVPTGGVV